MEFSIVIDAGSTGSRMNVFTLHRDGGFIKLKDGTYDQLEPGLGSFAERPREGALSLKPLLDKALLYVPESQHGSTTVSLKATAGLRSLPSQEQDRLLSEVYSLMKEYPFVVNDRSVEILDGALEGFFSWMTVSFLLGKDILSNDIAALDLGGGSVQVSYLPGNETLAERPGDVHRMKTIGGKALDMFTQSFEGAGLIWARGKLSERISESHELTGPSARASRFDRIHDVVKSFVLSLGITQLEELKRRDVFLMSYFFDLAVEAGLIEETDGVKSLQVEDYFKKAHEECEKRDEIKNGNNNLCMDLTFIYCLLSDGLGMDDTSEIRVVRTIHGTDVSWTLGAALSNLQL